ncbi:S-layer homology domain-containing protein [Psychrobacillus sp. FSL H8-0483]|uniref:S-layer homology domain-containing protein n=1 Tax=Psychrobacillus sp. FSL H8-0483 TaxID=2921389 RepID=UPI00315A0F25
MKFKKILLSAAAFAFVSTSVLGGTMEAEAATYNKTFKDVSKSNANYDVIHTMAQEGVISGYEDGTFKPNQTVNRKQAAALINRSVKDLPKTTSFNKPKDLSTSNLYYTDIKKLMEAGLLEADNKGNINPNKSLTRGEMAKILTVAYNLDTRGSHEMKDVSSKYDKYVTALSVTYITSGFEDRTFRENQSLTRAHYAAFMYRAQYFKTTEVTLDDLKTMTDAEILALGNNQLGRLILPYRKAFYGKVTLPEGQNDASVLTEQLKKQYNAKLVEMNTNYNISYPMNLSDTANLNHKFNGLSGNVLQLSPLDTINLINEAYTTGKVMTFDKTSNSRKFVMYFNYFESRLYIAVNSN